MKHTKGEWKVCGRNYVNDTLIGIHEYNSERIAHVRFLSEDRTGEQEANAKLIAAAPDLLEALKNVAEQLTVFSDMEVTNKESMRRALQQAKSAIKKATEG